MPDRIPNPDLTFSQRLRIRATSPTLWFGIAATIMAGAFLTLALNLTSSIEDKRAEDTCRSRIAGAVTAAQGEVTLAVGDALAALEADDEPARAEAREAYAAAKAHLTDSLAARERSEETCDQR